MADEECHVCGDEGTFTIEDDDRYCTNCYYVPTQQTERPTRKSKWRRFWDYRDSAYDGTYGHGRKRCVGGFRHEGDIN